MLSCRLRPSGRCGVSRRVKLTVRLPNSPFSSARRRGTLTTGTSEDTAMAARNFAVHYVLVGLAAAVGFWLCLDWTTPVQGQPPLVEEPVSLATQMFASGVVGLVAGVV